MELELIQNPPSFRGRECLIQARSVVRVQVVLDQPDLLGTGIIDVYQLPHACGIVPSGAPFRHLDMTPAPQRFAHHELVADAFPLVLIVEPSPHARARRLERPHFAEQLLTPTASFNSRSNVLVLKGVVTARSWLTEGTLQWSWDPCPLPPQVIELSVVKLRSENCFLLQKLFP